MIKLNETPLHWAVKRNYLECAELLLNFGADPEAEDSVIITLINYYSSKGPP